MQDAKLKDLFAKRFNESHFSQGALTLEEDENRRNCQSRKISITWTVIAKIVRHKMTTKLACFYFMVRNFIKSLWKEEGVRPKYIYKSSSCRLAGVNASPRRRAKMPILTNVIKTAINRFNIDLNDFRDGTDTCIPSKSSIHVPFAGGENDDVLALDSTKRCLNGPFLVRSIMGESRLKTSNEMP